MISYFCEKCNIEVETSVCPVCSNRASVSSQMFWCKSCNCPSFYPECSSCGNDCTEIGIDIRPVFPEERLLVEIILGEPLKYLNSSVWSTCGGRYIIDGHKKSIKIIDLEKVDEKHIIEEYIRHSEFNNYDTL